MLWAVSAEGHVVGNVGNAGGLWALQVALGHIFGADEFRPQPE